MGFWILWGIDAIVGAIAVAFFFIGIADGSVSSFNIALWLVILAALAAVLGGSFALHRAGKKAPAIVVAALLAVPGILAALFLLLVLVTNPRWN